MIKVIKDEEKITHGEVTNCSCLNVRSAASKNSPVKCIVNKGDILKIESYNTDWVKVVTPAGINGFCRKEFIRDM